MTAILGCWSWHAAMESRSESASGAVILSASATLEQARSYRSGALVSIRGHWVAFEAQRCYSVARYRLGQAAVSWPGLWTGARRPPVDTSG